MSRSQGRKPFILRCHAPGCEKTFRIRITDGTPVERAQLESKVKVRRLTRIRAMAAGWGQGRYRKNDDAVVDLCPAHLEKAASVAFRKEEP